MQTAYQPQVTPDHVPAHSITKQQSLDKREATSCATSDVVTTPATIGTFARRSTYRAEAQASPTQESMLPTMTTPSPSRSPPRHHKSKSAPNVRPKPSLQSLSSSVSNIALESPLTPSPTPLFRRKTVTHKQSSTGLVLNATPALEPLPRWSPYYCSNPDAETPTRRARNSTLPDDKRSFDARAVAAGMAPPSLVLDRNRACDELTTEVTSPTTSVTKAKRGLFRKSKSFGMLRRSTVSNGASIGSIPPLPMIPQDLPFPTPASPTMMTHTIDISKMQQYLLDITTPAKHRPHLELSTSPPPLISPSSSDAWSPTSASPSSPRPAFLNHQTYFLSSPPIPHRQSSKRVLHSSPVHDERIYFTPTSLEPTNSNTSRDLASSPSFSMRTATPDVDSRSFNSRMLYGASPSASLASVATTPLDRGRTMSNSSIGRPRTPRQHKLAARVDMPLPPLPRSTPACLPPSRPIPPVPVVLLDAPYIPAQLALSLTSTPAPVTAPRLVPVTASASFPSPTPTLTNHTLRRAASDTPTPARATTLQSFWDPDDVSTIDKPKPRPSSMPIWRKMKAGLHLAKKSWEKGVGASGIGGVSVSGGASV